MTLYSFDAAMRVLSETEKNRMLACFLSADNPCSAVANWDVATASFGAASVESMKVMIRGALKKIEKASGEDEYAGNTPAGTSTPAKGGRKRKTAADGDDHVKTPSKGSAKKARKTPVKSEPTEDDGPSDVELGGVVIPNVADS